MENISWLLFCYYLLSCLSKASLPADTLTANQSISDGQTLVSSRQVFEFGFFSPGNLKNRYVGIWYKNIPDTFVRVANRGYPVTDKSGTLNFSRDGNLVLFNGNGSVVWSLNSEEGSKHPILQILDSGNLVLSDESYGGSSSYIWQSFDHPTDTLLPGMRQGWDLNTGLNWYLTPWTSADDPSPGNYYYGVDLQGIPQLVLRMGSNKLYRSGVWYENRFSGGPVLVANSLFKPTFVANKEEVYYAFEAMDSAIYSRIVILESGLVHHFSWIGDFQWAVLYGIQKDHCDAFNLCGPFGVCYIINQSPKCECMMGFTPKSPKDWEVFNIFGGCVRIMPLECQRGNGFVKYPGMKLPDSSNL